MEQKNIWALLLLLAFFSLGFSLAGSMKHGDRYKRVVNGVNAPENKFPWMVALFNNGDYICTASIISERDILTAGHCVVFDNIPQRVEEFFGVIGDINKNNGGKRVYFNNITTHPKHNNLLNDLAVLRTTEDLTFDESIQPICLASSKWRWMLFRSVTAMGWGITVRNTRMTATPDVLQYTSLRVYPNIICSILYSSTIPNSILCAGAFNTGICAGDSGGPLVLNADSTKPVQVGVASFMNDRFGCARLLSPAGYTKISHFNKFINQAATGKTCFL